MMTVSVVVTFLPYLKFPTQKTLNSSFTNSFKCIIDPAMFSARLWWPSVRR